MIASLRGVVAEIAPGLCILEVAGVGYRVHVSGHTFESLPTPGEPAFLRIRQVVREDALTLFGFHSADEQRLFDLLVTVSGVGPRLAMAVLSGLKPEALTRAIREENLGALVAIPGIGRRTAERLVVELRNRVESPAAATAARSAPLLPRAERMRDAVAALVRLGYTAAQADEVLRQVDDPAEDYTLEDLVRRSLSRLARTAATVR